MRVIHKRQNIYNSVSLPVAGILSLNYFCTVKKKLHMTDPSPKKKNYLFYQLMTFKYAWNGLRSFFRLESKSRIHLAASIAVVVLGIVFEVSTTEWMMISFAIGLVFVSELLNTAFEEIVDMISQERSKKAGLVKDLAAAAVLMASLTALAIGLIIFLPKFIEAL